jgi:hypothetical protein
MGSGLRGARAIGAWSTLIDGTSAARTRTQSAGGVGAFALQEAATHAGTDVALVAGRARADRAAPIARIHTALGVVASARQRAAAHATVHRARGALARYRAAARLGAIHVAGRTGSAIRLTAATRGFAVDVAGRALSAFRRAAALGTSYPARLRWRAASKLAGSGGACIRTWIAGAVRTGSASHSLGSRD